MEYLNSSEEILVHNLPLTYPNFLINDIDFDTYYNKIIFNIVGINLHNKIIVNLIIIKICEIKDRMTQEITRICKVVRVNHLIKGMVG